MIEYILNPYFLVNVLWMLTLLAISIIWKDKM